MKRFRSKDQLAKEKKQRAGSIPARDWRLMKNIQSQNKSFENKEKLKRAEKEKKRQSIESVRLISLTKKSIEEEERHGILSQSNHSFDFSGSTDPKQHISTILAQPNKGKRKDLHPETLDVEREYHLRRGASIQDSSQIDQFFTNFGNPMQKNLKSPSIIVSSNTQDQKQSDPLLKIPLPKDILYLQDDARKKVKKIITAIHKHRHVEQKKTLLEQNRFNISSLSWQLSKKKKNKSQKIT